MNLRESKTTTGRIGRIVALSVAASLTFGGLAATAPAYADEPTIETSTKPETIPSLTQWAPGAGTFTFGATGAISFEEGNTDLEGIASILHAELDELYPGVETTTDGAGVGDIELILDSERTDLGKEGYELVIDESIQITGASYSGTFYGTRTLLQMLAQQSDLPYGSTVDIPQYTERGVTLCACVINISTEFIDRFIEEMSYLKLNTLMVELKMKVDGYPETNTWSYYTKDDLRELVAKANAYGIDVIPEINSPGHMEIWLENLPELQLTNQQTGLKDEVRMDITKDESFEFYTDLIDEYQEVFTSDYWHMGMDEYMLGSGYSNYPQVLEFARATFGANATEDDVVAWYSNKINAYVKSKDKKLRVWNDGIIRNSQVVSFDTDIIVEHWNNAASRVAPQTFVDWGHDVVNVSNSLYMVRGGYGINSANLYNGSWGINDFYNGKITSGQDKVRGARISLWPDGGTPREAENLTEQRVFEPLRFVAQMTWSNTKPWTNYAAFKQVMDTVGRPPLWDQVDRQPLPAGAFEISTPAGHLTHNNDGEVVLGVDAQTLSVEKSTHGYYTIKNASGQCLDLSRTGTMRLDVPVEIGAGLKFSQCATTTLQQWQVRKADGGYSIANAASQQFVSISKDLVDVPVAGAGFKNVADGLIVQTPGDWGKTIWTISGSVALSASPQSVSLQAGGSGEITVTVNNTTSGTLQGARLKPVDVPEGWTVTPTELDVASVEPMESVSGTFTVTNVAGGTNAQTIGFGLVDEADSEIARSSVALNAVCSTSQIRPDAIAAVSSQQLTGEPAPNGPAAAAIDGNAGTYWHSAWSPSDAPYPHSIVVSTAQAQELCGLWYTGRSSTGTGGANGRIANYEVYVSDTVATIDGAWGEPVATGTFANTGEPQFVSFDAQNGKFVKLKATSEVNGNPWATIGELALSGPYVAPVVYEPVMTLDRTLVTVPDSVSLTAAGFAPHEIVKVSGAPVGGGESILDGAYVADADGNFTATLSLAEVTASGSFTIAARGWASLQTVEQSIEVVVPAQGTTTALTASKSVAGTSTVITATVTTSSGTPAEGEVSIAEGKKQLGVVTLVDGTGTLSVKLSPGKHVLVGQYRSANTALFTDSVSDNLTVSTEKTTGKVTAKLSTKKIALGSKATVAVTVTAPGLKPTGQIQVLKGSKVLAKTTLSSSGKATVKLPALAVGKHDLVARYVGDTNVKANSVALGTLSVTKAVSTPSIKVNKDLSKITVTVKGYGTPTGKVSLTLDGKKIGTKSLSKGKATFAAKAAKKGNHKIVATYAGDARNAGSSAKVSLKLK